MVRGLETFQQWFEDFENQCILIGGTAARITMTEQGLDFRSTKDLDIALHVEVLTSEFGRQFWAFVQAGGYQKKERNTAQKPCLYRFQAPLDDDFPHTLELFSRVPDSVDFIPPGHLTPIPFDEPVSSLSAILLDEGYYRFVMTGRRKKHGVPAWVGEDRLIPLKAVAWLDMTERVQRGEVIDSRKINKHLTDIIQLSALLTPGVVIETPENIKADLANFLRVVVTRGRLDDMRAIQRIAAAYALVL